VTTNKIPILPETEANIKSILAIPIAKNRIQVLNELVDYVRKNISKNQEIRLVFICTHNSRRSQFAQVWAQTAAAYFNIPIFCFSGGVEVTACNERAITSLERSGFKVDRNKGEGENPAYNVFFSGDAEPVQLFSKIYDNPVNPQNNFAAIMTCSDADQNCPFVPGAEARIALKYDDPKEFDDTPQEASKYDERSMQIAAEMFYVFSQINNRP